MSTRQFLSASLAFLISGLLAARADSAMRTYSPPEGGYSVLMEGTPVARSAGIATMYMHEEKAGGYWITFALVPVSSNAAPDIVNRSLNGSCNGAVAGIHGKETARYTVNLAGGYPGRQIEGLLPNKEGNFRMRTYLVGNRLYQLIVAGTKDYMKSPKTTQFLNSLSLTEPGMAHKMPSASISSPSASSQHLDFEKHREEMEARSAAFHQKVTENLNRARKDSEQIRARMKYNN